MLPQPDIHVQLTFRQRMVLTVMFFIARFLAEDEWKDDIAKLETHIMYHSTTPFVAATKETVQ
jgi:hypothetical protein